MNRSTGTMAAAGGRRTASGFSLMEMVLAAAITSILMIAVTSAMILAGKAVPTGQTTADRIAQSGSAAHKIIAELQAASHITERDASSITFTVADRDGDGNPETIHYAWSTAAGDPLTREYNGGPAVAVLDDVYTFDLAYDLKSVKEQYPGVPVESAETELMSYNSIDKLSEVHVHNDSWWAQYFKPTLAPDAISWSVTRVKFMAKRDDNNAYNTTIQLRLPMPDNMPSDTVVDSTTMTQLSLTDAFLWVEKSFSNAIGLSPGVGLCLSFITTDPKSCRLRYQGSSVSLPDAGFIEGKPNWENLYTDRALLFYVYGTYATPGPAQAATRQYVTAVRVTLQVGEDAASLVETSVRTVNVPEVLSAVWETGFDGDPRQTDLNGDGGDWGEFEAAFDPQTLAGGIWYAPNASSPNRVILRTLADEDFVEPTTVEIRCRATSVGGTGVVFWANVDRTGSQCAPLYAVLSKPDAGSQQLRIGNRLPGGSIDWLAVYTNLPDGFLTVRLIVDPDLRSVAAFVDGAHKGTCAYTWGYNDTEQMAAVYTDGCSGEIDSVSIRVGTSGL